MLKQMRGSFHKLKWVLLAVVVAFVFGFVFIDMGLGGGGVGGSATDDRAFAAKVNGETITYNDYYRATKRLEDMYRQMYGQQFTPEMAMAMGLPKQVIDNLIDDRLLLQEAERLNLEASSAEVREKLLSIPTFKQDGKFIGMELYTRYVTGPLGYANAADFENDLAREISLQKMDSALRSSVVVSTKAADDEFRRSTESAMIRYVLMRGVVQPSAISVSPAEIEAYYKANVSTYQHGDQRKVRYLMADFAKIRSQIKPSEAELRRQYEANRATYRRPGSARVQHILIKVDASATQQAQSAARTKAESLVAQLRGGADFAEIARQNSEDPSSSGNGGDMGWVDMGQTVPAFERAIFSIPVNSVSDPIRTPEFGFHIVKVTERREEGLRTFEEVRPELTARAANESAKEVARAEINRVNAIIKQKKPATVEEFVKLANNKVTSNESPWFAKASSIPGIGSQPALAEWVFAAKPGDISDPLTSQRGILIAWVEDSRPAGVAPLEEIRRRVEVAVRQDKANETAKASLGRILAGSKTIDEVAQKAGTEVRDATVTREGGVTGLEGDSKAIVEAAIAANRGALAGPIAIKEGAVAFHVVDQKKVTDQELTQNRPQAIERLRGAQMRNLRTVLLAKLRKEASIEISDAVTRPTMTPKGV